MQEEKLGIKQQSYVLWLDTIIETEALLKMVSPGAAFRGGTLFRTKNK